MAIFPVSPITIERLKTIRRVEQHVLPKRKHFRFLDVSRLLVLSLGRTMNISFLNI